jgi:hypothetical protein
LFSSASEKAIISTPYGREKKEFGVEGSTLVFFPLFGAD